ncbi:MAG: hypothetical protein B6D41_02470 [Chloroflexi bacterium UTCFX4]|jgi:hypothetical protein|nr:MAG: hypothetical protein B6D41_02470 [Chloroflexi bacterium UTCFX4]
MNRVFWKHLALPTILILGAIALRVAASPLLIDDAYITFRYARNLAAGAGFVYNVGERVLGTSTPFFTILLALAAALRISPEFASVMLGVASDALLVMLFVALGAYLKQFWLGVMVGLLVGVYSQIVLAAVSGMETELYALLVVAALVLYVRQRIGWAVVCGALASWTRPEGGIVLVAIFVATLWRREWRWREWLTIPLILMPWALFSFSYFGSLLPHSVLAKVAVYPTNEQPWHNLVQIIWTLATPLFLAPGLFSSLFLSEQGIVLNWILGGLTILFSLALILGIWSTRSSRANVIALWFMLDLAFFALSNRYLFPWYTVPLYGVAFFLAGWGVLELTRRFEPKGWQKLGHSLVFGIIALVAVVMLIQTFFEITVQRSTISSREEMYLCIGSELDTLKNLDFVVASPEIGALGYGFSGKILDLTGLVSPAVIPYYQAPDFQFQFPHSIPVKVVQDKRPEVLVLFDQLSAELVASDWLNANYHRTLYYPALNRFYGSLAIYLRNDQRWSLVSQCEPTLSKSNMK